MSKNKFWLWTMDLGDVVSETDDHQEILKWHQFIMCIERRAAIESVKIVDIDQDIDGNAINNVLSLEYKVKGNTFFIVVVTQDIRLMNAIIKFDHCQQSQEIVQEYFFRR